MVLLACGIGVTPLLSLLGELPYRPGEATLIYRARTEADVAFRAELDWLAAHRGVRVVHLLGPRATGRPGCRRRFADHADDRRAAPDRAGRRRVRTSTSAGRRPGPRPPAPPPARPVSDADRLHTELFSW